MALANLKRSFDVENMGISIDASDSEARLGCLSMRI